MNKNEKAVYDTLQTMFGFSKYQLDRIVLYTGKVIALTKPPNYYSTILAEYKFYKGIPYPLFKWVHEDHFQQVDKHFDDDGEGNLKSNFRLTISSCGLPELMFRGKNATAELRAELKAIKAAIELTPAGPYIDFLAIDDDDSKWFAVRFRVGSTANDCVTYLNNTFKPKANPA